MAKGAGVPIHACGAWADILGFRDKLPAEMQLLETSDAIKLIAEANRHISV